VKFSYFPLSFTGFFCCGFNFAMGRPGHESQSLFPAAARLFRHWGATELSPIFFDCGAEKSFRRTGGESLANGVPQLSFWRGIDLFIIF
jgi:hypothetical protein